MRFQILTQSEPSDLEIEFLRLIAAELAFDTNTVIIQKTEEHTDELSYLKE